MVDESGMDHIFEGFFINGNIAWGRWWYMDEDTVYRFEGHFYQGRAHDKKSKEYASNGEM